VTASVIWAMLPDANKYIHTYKVSDNDDDDDLCRLQMMQQEYEDSLLTCRSKVAKLTEEINLLERAKSRLKWIAVGEKSYQKLKKHV